MGAVEDGVAVHAQMLIVGGEDNHGVGLAGEVAADVLRAVAGIDDGRLGARLGKKEILVVVVAERLHAQHPQFAPQVVGGDGVAPMLHATPVHGRRREVADDTTHIRAVLGVGK